MPPPEGRSRPSATPRAKLSRRRRYRLAGKILMRVGACLECRECLGRGGDARACRSVRPLLGPAHHLEIGVRHHDQLFRRRHARRPRWAGSMTVPAPTSTLSRSALARISMLRNGSGEFSGTSMTRFRQRREGAPCFGFLRKQSAQDRDERQFGEKVLEAKGHGAQSVKESARVGKMGWRILRRTPCSAPCGRSSGHASREPDAASRCIGGHNPPDYSD